MSMPMHSAHWHADGEYASTRALDHSIGPLQAGQFSNPFCVSTPDGFHWLSGLGH
jgi:hypothetical protein